MARAFKTIGINDPTNPPLSNRPLPPKKPPKKPVKPVRSGSHLGAPSHPCGTKSRGKHFGHHKTTDTKDGPMAAIIKGPEAIPIPKGPDTMPVGAAGGGALIPYLPPPESWIPTSMDIYNLGGANIPNNMSLNTVGVSISIAATPLEGFRSRTETGFGYTHVLIMDPAITIQDAYVSNSQGLQATQADYDGLAIPSAGNGANAALLNFWIPIIGVITNIPGIGRKKIVLADRRYVGNQADLF